MAALLINTSTAPNSSSVRLTMWRMLSSSRTLVGIARALPPASSISPTVEWMVPGNMGRDSSDRAATTTYAPSSAKPIAIALPIPRLEPVTMTTFSAKDILPSRGQDPTARLLP